MYLWEFKSYYVVWKLKYLKNIAWCFSPFKSYYVVWKPSQAEATQKKQEEFKSYYVVWKPVSFAQARRTSTRV